jgi:hypothetical protein
VELLIGCALKLVVLLVFYVLLAGVVASEADVVLG